MKTYITEKKAKEGVQKLNNLINVDDLKEIKRIEQKYDILFTRNRRTNMQIFWTMVIGKMNALPESDKFRRNLSRRGDWELRNETRNTIFDFMDYINCAEDYSFITKWDTSLLHVFIEYTLPDEFHIHDITLQDILAIGDYSKFFDSYLKKNCDKNALSVTAKMQAEFDSLLKGLTPDEKSGIINLFSQYAFSENMDFDTLHHLIHSGK